jgi:hypothetical protein
MQRETDELERRLRAWRLDSPPEDLARRIVAVASREPQWQPRRARLQRWLGRALTEWHYGLAFKAGALALCALIGLVVGQLQNTAPDTEPDYIAVALAQNTWVDEP